MVSNTVTFTILSKLPGNFIPGVPPIIPVVGVPLVPDPNDEQDPGIGVAAAVAVDDEEPRIDDITLPHVRHAREAGADGFYVTRSGRISVPSASRIPRPSSSRK